MIQPCGTGLPGARLEHLSRRKNTSNRLWVTQGAVNGIYTQEQSNVRAIALANTPAGVLRIGYVDYNNLFQVKEGSLGSGWTAEQSSVQDIGLSGDLIGCRDIAYNNFKIKQGALTADWYLEASSVRSIALAGN